MDKQKQKEQEDKLKGLAKKDLPENVRKSISEKIKHINKPFNK